MPTPPPAPQAIGKALPAAHDSGEKIEKECHEVNDTILYARNASNHFHRRKGRTFVKTTTPTNATACSKSTPTAPSRRVDFSPTCQNSNNLNQSSAIPSASTSVDSFRTPSPADASPRGPQIRNNAGSQHKPLVSFTKSDAAESSTENAPLTWPVRLGVENLLKRAQIVLDRCVSEHRRNTCKSIKSSQEQVKKKGLTRSMHSEACPKGQLIDYVRKYVSASCSMQKASCDISSSLRAEALRATKDLSEAVSHLDFEIEPILKEECSETSRHMRPPITNSGGKSRSMSKLQRRQAKIVRRKKIIEKIRPKIELSQAMRKDLDSEIQMATGVTWGKGVHEPRYKDTESNCTLTAKEYAFRYFERYLSCKKRMTAMTICKKKSVKVPAKCDLPGGEEANNEDDAIARKIAAAEERCWRTIEDAMRRLESERRIINDSRVKDKAKSLVSLGKGIESAKENNAVELKVSPIRAALGKHQSDCGQISKPIKQNKKKTANKRKRRRSIDMKVPDLFDDGEEDDLLFR